MENHRYYIKINYILYFTKENTFQNLVWLLVFIANIDAAEIHKNSEKKGFLSIQKLNHDFNF